MQLHLALEEEEGSPALLHMRDRLVEAFGPPQPHVRRDPVAQLVRSLIASRTQDAVSDEVLVRLRAAFRPLARLAEARVEEVLPVIAPVTHAERKASQLIEAIRRIGRLRGAVVLDFLEGWPVDDAMVWLQELPGVGQEVAASVLNVSTLNRRVMVVDTQVWRVAVRTGLADADADAGEVRLSLMDAAPDDWDGEALNGLHKLMKRLGQLHCHAAMPECPGCPLMGDCLEGERRFGLAGRRRPSTAAKSSTLPAANENAPRGGLDSYLRRRIARIEARGRRPWNAVEPVSFGLPALDAATGGRGLPPGAHQTAPAEPHDHAAPLILPLMVAARAPDPAKVKLLIVQEREAAREGGELYAPGLEAFGVAPEQMAFVRPTEGAEVLRVADEAVKRRAVPVVLAELRRGASMADLAATRRLNLAAQRQGMFLFFLTPDLGSTSAALTRWRIASAPSRAPPGRLGPPAFHLHLIRNRLGPTGEWAAEWSLRERRFVSAVRLSSEQMAAPVDPAPTHRSAAAGAA